MKPNPDETLKVFKGLAIAAARAKEIVAEHGREKLLADLPRRQQDTIRQHLLEIRRDLDAIFATMTPPKP